MYNFIIPILIFLCIAFIIFKLKNIESFVTNQQEVTSMHMITAPIEKGDIIFVRLYAKWCPHCTKMENEWTALHNELHGKKINNKIHHIYQIEDKNKEFNNFRTLYLNEDQIGFPTIIRIDKNKINYFTGTRTRYAMYNYLRSF